MAADHFEVASVKPAELPKQIRRHSAGRIDYEGIGFAELITKAFALPQYQIVWPDWVWGIPRDHPAKEKPEGRYFTIEATMPPGTSGAEFQLMLQNLLAERFGLVFHRETRQLARYEVSFARGGARMAVAKAVPDGPVPGIPDDNEDLARLKHANQPNRMTFGNDGMSLQGDYTVAAIAATFSQWLRHPMADRTGSDEYYAVALTWNWNPYAAPPFEVGMTNSATDSEARELFAEMERRLGLKVTLRSSPTEFLVIDQLRRDPTEN